jgi:hypothetical protein
MVRPRQLTAPFDFASWVAEFVKVPRTDFDLVLGFGWHTPFLSMSHIARSALEYVQVGQTVEPPRLSSQTHGLGTAWAKR